MKNPFYKFQLPANAYKLIDTSVGFQVAGDYHGYDSDKDGKAGIVISVDDKPIVEVENKEILFKTDAKDNYKILSSFIGLDGMPVKNNNNKSIAELAVPLLKGIENIETKGNNTFAERSTVNVYKKELNKLFEIQEGSKNKVDANPIKSQKGGTLQNGYLKGAGGYNWRLNNDGSFDYINGGKSGKISPSDSNYKKVESNLRTQIPSLFKDNTVEKVAVNNSNNIIAGTPPIIPDEVFLEKPLLEKPLSVNSLFFGKLPTPGDGVTYDVPLNTNNNTLTQEQADSILSPSVRGLTKGDADIPINQPDTEKGGINTLFKGVVNKVLNNKGISVGDMVQLAGSSIPYWRNKHSYPTVFKPNYVDNQPTLNMMKNTFIPTIRDYRAYNTAKSQIDNQSTGALNLASKVQLAANQGRIDNESKFKEYIQNQQFNQEYIKGLSNDAQLKNQAETIAADLTQKSHGLWDAKQSKAAEIADMAFNKLGTSLNQNKSDNQSINIMMEAYGIKDNGDGTYSADPSKIANLNFMGLKQLEKRIASMGLDFDESSKAELKKAKAKKAKEENITDDTEEKRKGGYINPFAKTKTNNINPYY